MSDTAYADGSLTLFAYVLTAIMWVTAAAAMTALLFV